MSKVITKEALLPEQAAFTQELAQAGANAMADFIYGLFENSLKSTSTRMAVFTWKEVETLIKYAKAQPIQQVCFDEELEL